MKATGISASVSRIMETASMPVMESFMYISMSSRSYFPYSYEARKESASVKTVYVFWISLWLRISQSSKVSAASSSHTAILSVCGMFIPL